jgi:hypothetical protein
MGFLTASVIAMMLQLIGAAPAASSISGVVVSGLTGAVLPETVIELRIRSNASAENGPLFRQTARSVVSGPDGTFTFGDVPAGDYQLVLNRAGSLQTLFIRGMSSSNIGPLPQTLLQLAAGQKLSGLRAAILPESTISGRVLGRTGQPYVGAVTAFVPATSRTGEAVIATYQTVQTNDRGEYRLANLAAGPYFLRAGPVIPQRPSGNGLALGTLVLSEGVIRDDLSHRVYSRACESPSLASAVSYFPGTPDSRNATVLVLSRGENRHNVDFTLAAEPRNVRVSITLPNTQPAIPPTTIELIPQSRFPETESIRCRVQTNGPVHFREIPEGDYLLRVFEAVSEPPPGGQFLARSGTAVHTEILNVTGRDLDVNVRWAPPAASTIKASILADSNLAPVLRQPLFRLRSYPPEFSSSHDLQVRTLPQWENGSWTLTAAPGNYAVDLLAISGACCVPDRLAYAKAIRFNNADTNDGLVGVLGNASGLVEITVAEPVLFRGRLTTRQGVPLSNRIVAVVPDLRSRMDLYRSAVTDGQGRFSMQVGQGDFKVFSAAAVDSKSWEIPVVLRAYEAQGQRVHIGNAPITDIEVVVEP